MKGVILAGGFGTRLRPLTHVINKHLLPVYNQPMVAYPLLTLKESGVKDVMIVSEESSIADFSKFFGSGDKYSVSLAYGAQKGAGGIAEALKVAKDFARGDSLAVILGDNIFEDDFSSDVRGFKGGAKIFLKKVSNLMRFGVPVFASEKIAFVEEKPEKPKSECAATGLYLFDNKIFDIIETLKPSARGELEITDAVNVYAKNGELGHAFVNGFWSDAGTFESLLASSHWAASRFSGGSSPKES